jgi:DNA repair exonuclease SbcCD nuclease subunit
MVKIVHTADLHLGLEFSRFPSISDTLKQERIDALKLIIQRSNSEGAHAVVIAGDLFDKLSISRKLVNEAKDILAHFDGEVIVIPGNHDWYNASAEDNKMWTYFIDAPGKNVHFLKETKPFRCTLNEQEVVFYPCGCHQKHSTENRIAWVRESEKQSQTINIGIAHGNVDGYGLDEEGNYFGMSVKELKESGMDCWLLGHIHAPYPTGETAAHETFYLAGNHCSESWKSERPGGAWLIEIDNNKQIIGSRWNHTGICFRDIRYDINDLNDLQFVLAKLKGMNVGKTVLRLTLQGSLTEDEMQQAKSETKSLIQTFLHAEPIWKIGLKITSADIDKLYVEDSIPYALLTALSQKEEDSLAMQLAYEMIKNLSE